MEENYTVEIFFILPGKKLDCDFWSYPPVRRSVAKIAEFCVFLHRSYSDQGAYFQIHINGKKSISEDPMELITLRAIQNLKKTVPHGQN